MDNAAALLPSRPLVGAPANPAEKAQPWLARAQAAQGHFPVMLPEVVAALQPRPGGRYLDATFGGGGYSTAILDAATQGAQGADVHAIDRDPGAISRGQVLAKQREEAGFPGQLHLHQGSFSAMKELAGAYGPFDGIVLDLGVSSFQIDQAERGFSFRQDGPLDMRMGETGPTASDIVNTASEERLADILYHYGEEKRSRRVARALVEARSTAPITTTARLADIIRSAVPRERAGFDPATRSFQGLRIAVNDELGELERALQDAPTMLAPGGRLVVVSFHSLEDRLVKKAFAALSGRVARTNRHAPPQAVQNQGEAPFKPAHSKPVLPSNDETTLNPRSRSARLRCLERRSSTVQGKKGERS
ncbi:16S rRNA (cytosine(1402)-N(4))-methyltransferase RsmH [Formicincola oecophyllae]|uniref:Ribosomal RNA small subunit methyltransferase H n=1 Tax=Formicincola oecophyllae TaxID=2558361 RepID=A0A4Y6U6L9_9PROT|nr:16S rRNA (cytosine(1402)-N(4))-methyltransferase RsmH [Formicincola oecophyllae]QDH13002.1 16S rRNA (cytosine(1402)-N(4))-methyltransferase RsmH [Formicincola oecophyllae]